MDFFGGLASSIIAHDYLYVMVDRFSKICNITPCKKKVTTKQGMQLFFTNVWAHFGLPTSIIYDQDFWFLGKFWSCLWDLMDTKMNKSISFYP